MTAELAGALRSGSLATQDRLFRILHLVYVVLALAYFVNWFAPGGESYEGSLASLGLVPKWAILLVEISAVVLMLRVFAEAVRTSRVDTAFPGRLVWWSFVTLVFLFPLGMLFGSSFLNFGLGIRNYFGFLPLFVAGYFLVQNEFDIRPVMRVLLYFALVQTPVSISQFVDALSSASWLRTGGTLFDVVSGTMGGLASGLLATILASTIAMFFGMANAVVRRRIGVLVVPALIIPMVLGEAKGGLMMLGIIAVYFAFENKHSLKARVQSILLSAAAIASFGFLYSALINPEKDIFSIDFFLRYEAKKSEMLDTRLSRLAAVTYSLETIKDNPLSFVGGVGLGNATKNPIGSDDGAFYSFWTDINAWNRLILEAGLVGCLLVGGGLAKLFSMSRFLSRHASNETTSNLGKAFACVVLITAAAGLYTHIFTRVQFVYPFSLLAGFVAGEYHKLKTRPMTLGGVVRVGRSAP